MISRDVFIYRVQAFEALIWKVDSPEGPARTCECVLQCQVSRERETEHAMILLEIKNRIIEETLLYRFTR